MIDIKDLVKNPEYYIKGLSNKKNNLNHEVHDVLKLYEKYLYNLKNSELKAQQLNEGTKLVQKERANPSHDKHKLQTLLNELKQVTDEAKSYAIEADSLLNSIQTKMAHWPNIAFDKVHVGKDETENKEVSKKHCGHKKTHDHHHFDIIKSKNLMYVDECANISGARHLFYKDKLLELLIATEKFMLDEHKKNGWELTEPPVIVNAKALYHTGQLPKFEQDLFKLTNDQYLIPTAEVPLTNLFANKMFDEKQLPIKLTALTNCFRSEAGAAGKDTKGMIRVHQFRKVELVSAGIPSHHDQDLKHMLNQATHLLDLLNLPYRVVELCTGDMGFASAQTFDIEVWLPAQNTYREISSVSCCTNFQARRMNAKFKDANGKKDFIYTYNGSALALERTLAAIIENYYDHNTKMIKVPEVLHKYLPFKEF